jgi:hypothetical protein
MMLYQPNDSFSWEHWIWVTLWLALDLADFLLVFTFLEGHGIFFLQDDRTE